MDETREYFGLLVGRYVSAVVASYIVTCYAETGKMPPTQTATM